MPRWYAVTPGDKLTGRVENVTSFGAFVDVGLKNAGLVHVSEMGAVRKSTALTVKVPFRLPERAHQ